MVSSILLSVQSLDGIGRLHVGFYLRSSTSFPYRFSLYFSRFNAEECGLLLTVCWSLQYHRNKKIWNCIVFFPQSVFQFTERSLENWVLAQALLSNSSSESSFIVDHWQCPLVVFLKVNMDIVTSMYNMCTDVGLIARNHMGCFVVARFFFSHEFFFSKSFRSDGHYGGTYLIKSCGLNNFDRVQCSECGGCSLVYLIPLYNSLMVLFQQILYFYIRVIKCFYSLY